MLWFGAPWPSEHDRAPICEDDTLRVATPVGETCFWCNEEILEDDRGVLMSVFREKEPAPEAMHIECNFRQVMGGPAHLRGECLCQGGHKDPDDGMTPREAALYVWRNWVGSLS
jgi:hypothetical protein